MTRKYSSISVESTLASGISNSATSLTVASGTASTLLGGVTFTAGNVDQFTLAIDPDTVNEEIVYATAATSDTLTIVRGRAGTSGISHSGGAIIKHVLTSADLDYFTAGVDSAVSLTGSQTLTNKTLTSPVIGTIVNTGTLTLPTATDTLVGRTTTDTLTNKTVTAPHEVTSVSATAATGTINFNAGTYGVLYYTTNASGNWVLNVRGDSSTTLNSLLSNNDAITIAFLATQGTTAYYPTSLTIDGTSVTPKWQAASTPSSGNTNSVDIYSYTIVKTASATFSVFASQTRFA